MGYKTKKDETPPEAEKRKRKQNLDYKKRSDNGYTHPKDKRGPHQRVIEKAKKGPFHGMCNVQNLKRDAQLPTVGEGFFSFKAWLETQEDAQG